MKNISVMMTAVVCAVAIMIVGCGQADAVKFSKSPAGELYTQAQALVVEGKILEAKALYDQIINEYSDFENIEKVQSELYALNLKILFSNVQTPLTVIHEVQGGDTLGKISKQYNVSMDLIKVSNNMTSDVVQLGKKLRIWTGKFSILVDKSQNILILRNNDDVLKVYSVSTGTNNSTPVGTFKIVEKLENPVWFKTGGPSIPAESPENALGTRWLGFDIQGYGIHGTIHPEQIGQQATNGCVRMLNAEVEELFKIVPRGTEVVIAD